MATFPRLEILLATVGVVLVFLGGYLYFQQWSHVNMRTREYSYINKPERTKRSLKAGFSAVMFLFGLILVIGPVALRPVTLASVSLFLFIAICTTPLIMVGATYRMYRELEPYTKMEDDVVFLDNQPEL